MKSSGMMSDALDLAARRSSGAPHACFSLAEQYHGKRIQVLRANGRRPMRVLKMKISRLTGQFLQTTIVLCFLTVSLAGCGADPLGHVSENEVPDVHFHEYLVRDLRTYFKLPAASSKSVGHEFINGHEGVYQTGTGYPHYFLWIYLYDGNKIVSEGFAKVDAVDKNKFRVATFISKAQIKKDPKAVEEAYGSSLGADIINRANRP